MTDTLEYATERFERSVDHARSIGLPAGTARTLLQLFALRFLSTTPSCPETARAWEGALESTPVHSKATQLALVSLANSVERRYPELEGIFTDHLVPGLRTAESLLREWVHNVDRVCANFKGDESAFGKWFDATIDSASGRGAVSLQYATPRNVADMMVRLTEPRRGETFHDPCVGTGSVLAATLARISGDLGIPSLSGQEIDPGVATLARLRLFLLGARNVRIEVGDVLRDPLFVERTSTPAFPDLLWRPSTDRLNTFDVVFCDPPYGQRLANTEFVRGDRYKRFRHGTPGRTSSDVAFLQHSLACLKPGGRAIALVAHGPLFRGGGDREIREKIIRDDLIEAVIGLPFGALPGLSIEPAIILCRHGKDATRRDRVLFIDASSERDVLRNTVAWDKFAAKVVGAYAMRAEIPSFSRVVSVGEIEAIGFSLQPRRYVAGEERNAVSLDLEGTLARAGAQERKAEQHAAEMAHWAAELASTSEGDEGMGTAEWKKLAPRERLGLLTPRERQVLIGVVAGRVNKQIAMELGVVEKTIKVHRARVMRKMAAHSLMELVYIAAELGIHSSSG